MRFNRAKRLARYVHCVTECTTAVSLRYTPSPLAVHRTCKFLIFAHYFLSRYAMNGQYHASAVLLPRTGPTTPFEQETQWVSETVGTLFFIFVKQLPHSGLGSLNVQVSISHTHTHTHTQRHTHTYTHTHHTHTHHTHTEAHTTHTHTHTHTTM
jgi:hypothetical protein